MLPSKTTKTQQTIKAMKIVSWVVFVGFSYTAGIILISFIVSFFDSATALKVYNDQNLYKLCLYDFPKYSLMIMILIAFVAMKATIWYMVIKIISKIELKNPFTNDVVRRLENISYIIFITGILGFLGNLYLSTFREIIIRLNISFEGSNFVLLAILVFIISQIFKRGVELQSENELTV